MTAPAVAVARPAPYPVPTPLTSAMLRLPLAALALLLAAGPALAQEDDGPPPAPDFTAARALGFAGPLTTDQGALVAARHLGADTARLVEEETERGALLFEYVVETASGPMEVEVRQSDGAVLEVEPADDEEDDDNGEEGDDGLGS